MICGEGQGLVAQAFQPVEALSSLPQLLFG